MNSCFHLILDTTPPQLEIYAPSYTTKNARTPIIIKANETLSSYQEIYIIDSYNNRHDLTFAHDGDSFVGELYFKSYPIGISTLYVRVKDEVDNLSKLYSHSISIMESEILTCKMDLYVMKNKLQVFSMKNEMLVIT